MADIGRLRWILTADTQQFDRAMRRTAGNLRRIGNLVAGGFAAGRVSGFARGALETVDTMAKLARAADVTVTELQALRHTADLAGVSQDRLDQSLLDFTRRLGEAQMGFGRLFRTMRDYDRQGLITLLRTQDTTEALIEMSRIIQRAPSQPAAAALTSAAFGTGNLRMVNLMRQGPGGLAAGARSAMENLTFVTQNTARTIEELQDTATRAYGNIESTTLNATASILAQVSGVIQRIDRLLLDFQGGDLAERAARVVGTVFNFVAPGASRTTR